MIGVRLISELKAERHSVGGLGGLIGRKKGAVAIRINYDDIKMVFIACHLAGTYFNLVLISFLCYITIHYIYKY